ncbi:uroporphyrinogen-III synthase [Promicromonospora sp. NPDC050880]|uniref:uroporphyrinogen-III synthase n=1 Tax=Promicromonospora sp. NPDC050880 TaxID=3364406 RepID=UPI0037A51C6E
MTERVPPSAARPTVLVARSPERSVALLALLRERGLDAVAAPVIERATVEDPAELDAARNLVAAGGYAWVAITSVNAVDALLGPAEPADTPALPGGNTPAGDSVAHGRQRLLGATHLGAGDLLRADTPADTPSPAPGPAPSHTSAGASRTGPVRWAAVGPATRQALEARGVTVDLVPGTATGAGLADAFPAAPAENTPAENAYARRVLLPLGDLASGTLRAGLVAKGWTVDVVTAYRTVAHELPPELHRRYDAVVVASGSAARQVAAQLGPQRVVAIGEPSARAAGAVGHTVLAVAAEPTDAALADAVTEALVSI